MNLKRKSILTEVKYLKAQSEMTINKYTKTNTNNDLFWLSLYLDGKPTFVKIGCKYEKGD